LAARACAELYYSLRSGVLARLRSSNLVHAGRKSGGQYAGALLRSSSALQSRFVAAILRLLVFPL
jgi:hypothetical protein